MARVTVIYGEIQLEKVMLRKVMFAKVMFAKVTGVILVSGLFAGAPQEATARASIVPLSGEEAVEHGGGCRKASPPGQCCHAGSKPYHCH